MAIWRERGRRSQRVKEAVHHWAGSAATKAELEELRKTVAQLSTQNAEVAKLRRTVVEMAERLTSMEAQQRLGPSRDSLGLQGSEPFLVEGSCLASPCSAIYLAEGEGFEPSIRLTTDNGFRDRRIRPLCHPSGAGESVAADV